MLSERQFLTTGEAGKILGVSASTIIRRFDNGELEGKRHPLTGRRLVAQDSLATFIAAHNLPLGKVSAAERRILLADGDALAIDVLRSVFHGDPHVQISSVGEGSEVCGRILAWRPDLAIINMNLPDMAGRDVVRCVRSLPGLTDLRIALSSPPDFKISKSALRELGVHEYFPKPWTTEALAGRLARLLGMSGWTRPRPKPLDNRRRWPRMTTDWTGTLKIYVKGGSKAYDSGSTRVRNVCWGGAFLTPIQFKHGVVPANAFTLVLCVTSGPAKGFEVRCRPVRIKVNGELGLGVEFMRVSSAQSARLARALT